MRHQDYTNRCIELPICATCGATVGDEVTHDAWHHSLARATPAPLGGVERKPLVRGRA